MTSGISEAVEMATKVGELPVPLTSPTGKGSYMTVGS